MIEVNDLIGKPFSDKPTYSPDANSFSCYSLIWEVYRRFGIDIPKTNISVTACRQASNQEILEHAARYWEPVETPEVPCGVLIQSVHPDYANHIGIYIGSGKMLHVTMNHNVEISRIEAYRHKILGFYRYTGARK